MTLAVGFLPGCAAVNRLHHPDPGLVFAPGDQPDKVLFQKALHEINHSRFEVGRLTLQTLINTYPDSEYLSKAKLAIANSYFEQGGIAGYTQAESEYKDFITFFPTAPEAPEAQYRVGMSHFKLLAKADRDQTEALAAEAEFKDFLLKYPDSPLVPRVKGRLRETQEVLAQGDFYTADFYYEHNAFLAARSRFQEIVDKYPNFSAGDKALFYLGQSLERLRRGHQAVVYYSHVLTDFPLSPLVPQAKARLIALKAPIPRPTRAMLARAEADATHVHKKSWMKQIKDLISNRPDTSATLYGPVHLGKTGSGIEIPPANEKAPANATIQASPVNEKNVETHNPAEPAPNPESNRTKGNNADNTTAGAAKPAEPATNETEKGKGGSDKKAPEETAKPKKKSHFHFFKKVIPPI